MADFGLIQAFGMLSDDLAAPLPEIAHPAFADKAGTGLSIGGFHRLQRIEADARRQGCFAPRP